MNTMTKTLSVLSAVALLAGSAQAAPISVINHSFEDGADGRGGDISQPTWLRSNRTNLTDYRIPIEKLSLLGAQADPAPDGTDTVHYTNNNTTDNIYQVLFATLEADTVYTLTVDVGDRTNLTAQDGAIRLGYVSASPTTTQDYGLNLLTADVINDTVPVNGASATDGWETWVSTFTTGSAPAGLGQPLRVELVSFGAVQTLWDNVRLDATPIPEPAAGLMALAGLGALAVRRRRG